MAIERNLSGFETGDQGELLFGGSGGVTAAFRDIVTTVTRSGTYALKLAPSGGTAAQAVFPAGSVTGTSGTVTIGNHKRARARIYVQIASQSWQFGNQAQRLFGFGTDIGYAQINNGTSTIASTGIGIWLFADGRFFLHVPPGGYAAPASSFTTGTVVLSQWYELTLDVDYLVAANTTVTASARIRNADGVGTPMDQTITVTNSIGASDSLRAVSCGSGFTGGFAPTYLAYFDDLVWIAASDTDAVSTLVLPTDTRIVSFMPTGTSVNAWSGTAADVDERPVASPGTPSGGDTINSTAGTGTTVTFTHPSAATLGIGGVRAWKLLVNAAATGAGTGLVDVILNGVTQSRTLATTFPAATGTSTPVGGLNWADLPPSVFNAATFSVVKQNGTQQTYLGNLVSEVLAASVPEALVITTTTLPTATSGTAYNQTIVATGGTPPYTFSLVSGTLPPGLTLATSGTVTGTPPALGTVAPTTLPDVLTGTPYSQALSVVNTEGSYACTVRVTDALAVTDDQALTVALTGLGPYTYAFQSGTLPPGLTLSSAGVVAGTVAGSVTLLPTTLPNGLVDTFYSQQLSVGNTNATYPVTVRATIGTVSPPDRAYTVTVSAWVDGSDTTYAVVLGALPKCLQCYWTGLIRGYPLQVLTASFSIRATDRLGRTVERAYTITSTS